MKQVLVILPTTQYFLKLHEQHLYSLNMQNQNSVSGKIHPQKKQSRLPIHIPAKNGL